MNKRWNNECGISDFFGYKEIIECADDTRLIFHWILTDTYVTLPKVKT